MKKIAMIATDIALAGEKGLGRMYYLAELFCKNGIQVDLFTSKFQHWLKRFRTREEMEAIQSASNCHVIFIDEPGYTKNVQLKRILSRRVLTRNILEHMEQESYDLIYSQIPDNHLASVAAAYAKKKDIPFVVDIEDLWPEAMRMVLDVPVISDVLFSYFSSTARKTYRLADAAVGSSDTYRDEPLKYNIKVPRSVTVYVGSELGEFDQEAAENLSQVEKPEGEFWVTYAGTLGTSYDIATLIRAADILEKHGVSAEVIQLNRIAPLNAEAVLDSVRRTWRLLVLEDCFETGCIGQQLSAELARAGIAPRDLILKNLRRRFVGQGTVAQLRADAGIDSAAVVAAVLEVCHE